MPLIDRVLIRTSLLYLAAGAVLGGVLLGYRYGAGRDPFPAAQSIHAHLLLVGWLLQLVMGVAHWLLPRRHGTRPDWKWPAVAYGALNLGLLARVFAQPFASTGDAATVVLIVGGGFQAVAILIFVAVLWQRVMARRQPARRSAS